MEAMEAEVSKKRCGAENYPHVAPPPAAPPPPAAAPAAPPPPHVAPPVAHGDRYSSLDERVVPPMPGTLSIDAFMRFVHVHFLLRFGDWQKCVTDVIAAGSCECSQETYVILDLIARAIVAFGRRLTANFETMYMRTKPGSDGMMISRGCQKSGISFSKTKLAGNPYGPSATTTARTECKGAGAAPAPGKSSGQTRQICLYAFDVGRDGAQNTTGFVANGKHSHADTCVFKGLATANNAGSQVLFILAQILWSMGAEGGENTPYPASRLRPDVHTYEGILKYLMIPELEAFLVECHERASEASEEQEAGDGRASASAAAATPPTSPVNGESGAPQSSPPQEAPQGGVCSQGAFTEGATGGDGSGGGGGADEAQM